MSIKKAKKQGFPIRQGLNVFVSGTTGVVFAMAPFALLLSEKLYLKINNTIVFCIFWILVPGTALTFWWSEALHKRVAVLRGKTENKKTVPNKKGAPGRLPWLPMWIGVIERILYLILIGFNIQGAGAFVAAWIGVKLASGWGTWSEGQTYGRAVFFVGMLGNSLSLLFGISTGLLLQHRIL